MDRWETPDLNLLITPPHKRRYKVPVALGIAALLVAIGWFVLHHLNSPVVGVVHTPSLPAVPAPKPITMQGKRVTFTYPSNLKRLTPSPLAPLEVEKYLFSNGQYYGWTLGMQIKQLPDGRLTSDTSYTFRLQAPEQYKAEQATINGTIVPIMTEEEHPGNKVAFLTHADLVAEVVLNNGDDKGQQVFTDVLQSWHWL